ncbi:MAG: serine hydrolase [Bacteroidota bacterium]
MDTTFTPFEISNQPDLKVSEFYTKRASGFKKAIEVNNFYKLAGGGYLSTSIDIAKMGQAILEKQLFKKGIYGQLFWPQRVNKKSTFYGLGFQVSQDAIGRSFVGHIGNSVGAYTNFFVYPKDKVVISILINCTDPKIQDKLDGAVKAVISLNDSSI